MVVAFDRPGHGFTARPPADTVIRAEDGRVLSVYSEDFAVELSVELLRHLRPQDPVSILGVATGATIGARAAAKFVEQCRLAEEGVEEDATKPPSHSLLRLSKLVLISPADFVCGTSLLPTFMNTLMLSNNLGRSLSRQLLRNELGDFLLRRSWHDPSGLTPEVLEGYKKPMNEPDWDVAMLALAQHAESPQSRDALRCLAGFQVLVVAGDHDDIVNRKELQSLVRQLKDLGIRVVQSLIPRCGHLPAEECPEACTEALKPFLTGEDLEEDDSIRMGAFFPGGKAKMNQNRDGDPLSSSFPG